MGRVHAGDMYAAIGSRTPEAKLFDQGGCFRDGLAGTAGSVRSAAKRPSWALRQLTVRRSAVESQSFQTPQNVLLPANSDGWNQVYVSQVTALGTHVLDQ